MGSSCLVKMCLATWARAEGDSGGIDTHNSGEIRMGSNHELTGADRLTGDMIRWGYSSIGRARALQARGTGIETRILHSKPDWSSGYDSSLWLRQPGLESRIWQDYFAFFSTVSVAQWIRRETTNLEIAGSSPVGDKKMFLQNVFFDVEQNEDCAIRESNPGHTVGNGVF